RRGPDDGAAARVSHRRGAGQLDPPAGLQGQPDHRLRPHGARPVRHPGPVHERAVQHASSRAVGGPGARVRALPPALTRRVFLAAVILLTGLGLVAQFRSYAGPDTGFLLDEAARILHGERLYIDLVDMNAPLIVGFNVGAVMLARAAGI